MSGLAQNFDLTNGINILRLICGLFFIPHIVGKFTVPATLEFLQGREVQSAGDLDVYRLRHRDVPRRSDWYSRSAALRRRPSPPSISSWPRAATAKVIQESGSG